MMLEQVFKNCVLTKDLACLLPPHPHPPAASLKPMRDCALFDSYSESLPGGQQTRDFSRTEVRRHKQGSYLAECRGIAQLQHDCGTRSSRTASL